LAGIQKFGEPIVFCNWDSWAGHYKPKCVGAPQSLLIEQVSKVFAEAVTNNISASDQLMDFDFTDTVSVEKPVASAASTDVPQSDEDVNHKEIRQGAPFLNPCLTSEQCDTLLDLCKKEKLGRVVVIGDSSGEACHTFDKAGARCYAIATGDYFNHFKVSMNVSVIDGEPGVICSELDSQEIDGVLVVDSKFAREGADWLHKHVKGGGFLILACDENAVEGAADRCERLIHKDVELRALGCDDGTDLFTIQKPFAMEHKDGNVAV
jgi:hypothetical protein